MALSVQYNTAQVCPSWNVEECNERRVLVLTTTPSAWNS